MSFRLKQMGLALCLMASLLISHASVCTCSHHEESKTSELDCHSHHEASETVEIVIDGDVCDTGCICTVEQTSPYAASSSPGKEFKSSETATGFAQTVADLEFVTILKLGKSKPYFVNDLSYSYTLKSLLPSRAPPRL